MKKLNLGSGNYLKEGFVNVDYKSFVKPDLIHNLNCFPYPFNENEFDIIECDHCLEHLKKPFKVMQEIHRVGKPNALVTIKVPHFSRGFAHPEHKSGFDITFPLYFKKEFKGGFQGVEFRVKKVSLHWFAQKHLKKEVLSSLNYYTAYLSSIFIDLLANASPILCARIWCYWVGGFEEIEFSLEIVK